MRIRKKASKLLLGSASSIYSNPWPSPPATTTAASADADEGFVKCEFNCSPWDVMVINPCFNLFTNPKGDFGTQILFGFTQEEDDEGILGNFIRTAEGEVRGILGNLIKTEEEQPISAITSNAAELSIKVFTAQISETKVEKIERKKKSKGKEKAAAEKIIAYCKKSDGKGWHCKRHAQLPHTLCSYHLSQIRSYHSKATDASASAANNGKNHQRKAGGGGGCVDSNMYYYYDGFGPWRRKRRGRAGVNAQQVKEDSSSSRENIVDDDDIVADDEYNLDCFDEDDDDDDNSFSLHVQDDEEINGKKEGDDQEEKKMVEEVKKKKKKGRKPLKSRSLKSLL